MAKADLKSINDIIDTNKFLLGDKPCDVDASVFGMMCQFMYHVFGPLNDYIKSNCCF